MGNAAILTSTVNPVLSLGDRLCGRYLATEEDAYNAQSICSFRVPYELGVDFNDDEICSANTNALTCESQVTKNSRRRRRNFRIFSLLRPIIKMDSVKGIFLKNTVTCNWTFGSLQSSKNFFH